MRARAGGNIDIDQGPHKEPHAARRAVALMQVKVAAGCLVAIYTYTSNVYSAALLGSSRLMQSIADSRGCRIAKAH
jgi:hypothetical protein